MIKHLDQKQLRTGKGIFHLFIHLIVFPMLPGHNLYWFEWERLDYSLGYLNTWSLVGRAVWGDLGGTVALLKKVHHWRQVLKLKSHMTVCFLCFLLGKLWTQSLLFQPTTPGICHHTFPSSSGGHVSKPVALIILFYHRNKMVTSRQFIDGWRKSGPELKAETWDRNHSYMLLAVLLSCSLKVYIL